MAYYGLIDLGSNSIRLVVYDVAQTGGPSLLARDIREVIDEKKIASMSAYVKDGVLTDAGIKCAVSVLKRHLECLANFQCESTAIFATAFLRNCSNSQEAKERIEEGIGAPIHLLAGDEEAYLGFVGASLAQPMGNGLLVDMGGGSTELTLVSDYAAVQNLSMPVGSVSLYEQFVSQVIPTPDEQLALKASLRMSLSGPLAGLAIAPETLFGIGGSIRAAAKIVGALYMDMSTPRTLTRDLVDAVLNISVEEPWRFSHAAVKAVPERIHTVVPGCLLVQTLMERLSIGELGLRKFGLREGYLIKHLVDA